MYDASVAIDFSPLSKIGDHFVKQREDARDRELMATAMGTDVASAGPQIAAPGPAASTSPRPPAFAGGGASMGVGTPADPKIEAIAIDRARQHVGDNPFALAAFAAHGNDESAFSAKNITGSWSDPSQSGKAGTSGGVLSWRDPAGVPARYSAMKQATASAGNDPYAATAAQTDFAFTENPGLTQRLKAAKSLPEAFSLLAASQQYAGWNDPNSPVNARRMAKAEGYLQRFNGQGGAPAPQGGATAAPAVQVAQMQGAPGAQPGAAPAQNPAKRAALVQLLNSGNPAMRETARFLLNDMKKDDNWQLTEHAGQKFFYNTRTRQMVGSGLPAERHTQTTLPDGRTANVSPTNEIKPIPEAREPRRSVEDDIKVAREGAIRVNDGVEDRIRALETFKKRGILLSPEEEKFYLTNNKLPEKDPDDLKPDERKLVIDAEDDSTTAKRTVDAVKKALELNGSTYQGVGAGKLGRLAGEVPAWLAPGTRKTGTDTQNFENLLMKQVLGGLKETFGGNPTEGERAILIDVEGSANKPAEVRKEILERARAAAENRGMMSDRRAAGVRGKSYFKPGGGAPAPGKLPAGVTAEQAIAEAREKVREGADPAAVKRKLETYGIKTDQF